MEVVLALEARRVVMTHIEESDGLTYDDLAEVAARIRERGVDLTFAYDTLSVEV